MALAAQPNLVVPARAMQIVIQFKAGDEMSKKKELAEDDIILGHELGFVEWLSLLVQRSGLLSPSCTANGHHPSVGGLALRPARTAVDEDDESQAW